MWTPPRGKIAPRSPVARRGRRSRRRSRMADVDSGDSVTMWIESLKAGGAGAATKLWRRYFEGPVRLARERLREAPRAVADEEDAALNAFDSLVRGASHGR